MLKNSDQNIVSDTDDVFEQITKFSLSSGDRITLHGNYSDWIDQVITDIDSAKLEISIEMYIFESDGEGLEVAKALKRASKRGVDVKLMVDGLGTRSTPDDFFEKLLNEGIMVRRYNPVHWWTFLISPGRPLRKRNHRKLILIDQKIGHIGGMNFGSSFREWEDLSLRIKGPFVGELYKSHACVWSGQLRYSLFLPWRCRGVCPEIQLLDNFYSDQYSPIKKHYLAAMKKSRKRILLAHGYFFPDKRLRREMRKAAKRGVRVEVVVPKESDIPPVSYAARHLYGGLLRNGIHIYEMEGKMLHTKAAVVDDRWLTIGSANLDPISLFSCLEINVGLRYEPLIGRVAEIIEDYKLKSRKWDYDAWVSRPFRIKLLGWFWFRLRRWYADWD